ncbi:hypothetical protein BDW62DRAFT_176319 [Aspergillus aurantiobrunneus]
MPGPIITSDPVLPVRELGEDEQYVMMAFEGHADHCTQCNDPLQAREEDRSLCERGNQYARDVNAYLYSKNGKAYSVVDREHNQPTLVKIPRDCSATRALLLAIEDGLDVQRKQKTHKPVVDHSALPIITYDRTYHVPPRRSSPVTEIIEREPRTIKSRRIIVYPSPHRGSSHRGSPSRGSLYDSDAADRVERVKESSRVYRPAEYYR